jgi:glycerate 2-kinase
VGIGDQGTHGAAASPDRRLDLERIAAAAVAAVEPGAIVRKALRVEGDTLRVEAGGSRLAFDLSAGRRVMILGFGKASAPMAQAAEDVLGDRIGAGLVVVKPGHELPLRLVRQVPGSHPVPDESSARAAREIAALADAAGERTLAIVLVSGGGSALVAAPLDPAPGSPGVTIEDIRETTRRLLACGADIGQVNCIRRHLLLLAGGRLAARLAPAAAVGLALSDVVGDDLSTIASGPLCADPTTYQDALDVVDRFGIGGALPGSVMDLLCAGAAGRVAETPKPGDPSVARAATLLIGTNRLALEAAAAEAGRLGFRARILSSGLTGEAREAALTLAAAARGAREDGPVCLLFGGETTVTLRGKGRGGRNQEMALAFLREMLRDPGGMRGVSFLSAATDGEDGPTDAAGGFALPSVAARASVAELDAALADNDSYACLARLGALHVTGPTNTNVCDIQAIIVEQ